MNVKIKSCLTVALAGAMLLGTVSCGQKANSTKDPVFETSGSETTTQKVGSGLTDAPEQYIKVPDLASIKVSSADVATSLQSKIKSLCDEQAYEDYVTVDDAAKYGDTVNIDYEGRAADEGDTVSEETLGNMKAENTSLILGSNTFIDDYYDAEGNLVTEGFEDQLIGVKANETREITVTFPDNYRTEELQGLRVIFTVTVHAVSRIAVDDKDIVTIGYFFTAPEGSDSEAFKKLFPAGSFRINYASEEDSDEIFSKIFPTADYKDEFLGLGKFDRVDRKLTVPEDAGEEYSEYIGQTLDITLWVERAITVPEWNDEFVSVNTADAYKTTAAYEELLKQRIVGDMAYDLIIEQTTMDNPPAEEIDALYKQYIAQLIEQVSETSCEGLTDEEIKALVDEETYADVCESATTQANKVMKERLVQEYLIILLGVTLSDEEYQAALDNSYENYLANYLYYYVYYGMDFQSAADLETYYGKSMLELQFMMSKVKEMLHEKVTVE